MGIVVRDPGGKYIPAPAGAHAAVCCDVIDLGMVKGIEKDQHKVKIVWMLEDVRDDGKPYLASRRYTMSLHEKAALRKDLESWRGRGFTAEELQGFDLEVLLGIPAMLNIIHVPGKDGGTYANIAAVIRLPKGMAAPRIRDYVRVCDRTPESGPESVPMNPSDEEVPF